MAQALIGLGANLGDRAKTLREAVERLAALPATRLLAHSTWLTTAPVGGPAGQDPFLNGAALLETGLEPAKLHDGLHMIEADLGRRRGQRWEARVLDLDLLLYDDLVIRTPHLEVPHPGLAYRRFVLAPAAEIAPGLRHPTIGWSIGQLLAHLDSSPNYLALHGLRGTDRSRFATQLAQATGAELLTLALPPSDPPIQSREQGIEFLAAMERALADVALHRDRAFVSDFCWYAFPEWLGTLAPDDKWQLSSAWQASTGRVTMPKLLVVLGGPPFVPGESNACHGPFLQVNSWQVNRADAQQDALAEVVAAVEAMR